MEFGEYLINHLEKSINCDHNFRTDYLTKLHSKKNQNFFRYFNNLSGHLVLTNFRLLFLPTLDLEFQTQMRRQPNFVREFFNIPLGLISRIEKTVSMPNDPSKVNKYNAYSNQPVNYLEVYTKDMRQFKFVFSNLDGDFCNDFFNSLDRACFIDNSLGFGMLSNTFSFCHAIDINDQNWINFVDGWAIYEDVTRDAARMGIDLKASKHFRLFNNENFQVCSTYPKNFIVPRKMKDKQVIDCSKFRTKNRLPALSYFHKGTGCSMWRAS